MNNKEFFDDDWEGVANSVFNHVLNISQMIDKDDEIAYSDLLNLFKNRIMSDLESLGKELDEMED